MPERARVITQIEKRMIGLIEDLTPNPELRMAGQILAKEFSAQKFAEGLEAAPKEVDVDATARSILKKQMQALYEHRDEFTPMERLHLQELAKLIAKL